ncbi:hypothetical protein TNCV_535631 [Trichonephila clavipes]|nr:hypothetical protein TNCV_535631 [Trichonephila clavipes]
MGRDTPDESRFSSAKISPHTIWQMGSAIIPRTSLKVTGMEVAVFSFGEASCLVVVQTSHIFDAGSVNGTRYCDEILLPAAQTPAARTLPPVTIRELRMALQDEWAAMPQQLIDTLILSMADAVKPA